jgi:hypothetical protein
LSSINERHEATITGAEAARTLTGCGCLPETPGGFPTRLITEATISVYADLLCHPELLSPTLTRSGPYIPGERVKLNPDAARSTWARLSDKVWMVTKPHVTLDPTTWEGTVVKSTEGYCVVQYAHRVNVYEDNDSEWLNVRYPHSALVPGGDRARRGGGGEQPQEALFLGDNSHYRLRRIRKLKRS